MSSALAYASVNEARRQEAVRPRHLGFQIHSWWVIFGLLAVSLLLMSLIYAPIDQWYLAFVCMVPWLIVIGGTAVARRVYVTAWLLGFAFFLINMWWMEGPTGMGYVALSAYLACYFPLAAWPIRHAVRRRRFPLSVAVPIVWVGSEYLRGLLLSGFPWFFLGHSLYARLSLIQISDLVGAYGVSFVLAAFNGAVADLVFARYGQFEAQMRAGQVRRGRVSVAFALLLLAGTLVYGLVQLSRDTMTDGPKIALLQQDFPNYTDEAKLRAEPGPFEKMQAYFELMSGASGEDPDLYLFPETAWSFMHLNKEFREADPERVENKYLRGTLQWSRDCFDKLQEWARMAQASVVIGSMSVTPTPLSLRATQKLHNSAFHIKPDGSAPERHDKMHPVLFGETVPFRYGRLRFLYFWLNSLSPFGTGGFEYSLTPGADVEAFTMTTREGRQYRFGVPICYEDVMPYVCRRFVWGQESEAKRVDFLLNISNDGWFLHRNELPQHFAICTFRAVENRVGIARTVNTGISGFIRPDGRSHDKMGIGEVGFRVARVAVDSRVSVYSRTGDVFAIVCALIGAVLYIDYIVVRARAARDGDDEAGA